MALPKFLVALVALLAIFGSAMAQLDPSLLAPLIAACGPGILELQGTGQACLKKVAKAKKTCPSVCRKMILASPSAECTQAVLSVLPATSAKKMKKVCKRAITAGR